ncbi:MAG TPA: bifunctional phosphoribosylaminoimidazolecarboxamide formyltransferase/IMP cyclohydrolase [Elusimicrobiales bacterium]|nr:bifunctional phosphoribosylaminoimidazolecarboxamide formyltransferase/IMP cyclohydrolase [Elusimicrobiales bacterium]
MKNIAVFASGEGTNLQALIDASKAGRLAGRVSLVVSSRDGAGALRRAGAENIPGVVADPKKFADPRNYDAYLKDLCLRYRADLVCLAGFMLKLGPELLDAFRGRILNVHPALLPAFGGKGFYGMKLHEAVLASGVRLSGATVHVVDSEYDRGPVVLQRAVDVFSEDTPASLAARVAAAEHAIYPKAADLFCRGLARIEGNRVVALKAEEKEPGRVRRVLISVSDKSGVVDFARGLSGAGVEIVSTSGTYKLLAGAGVPVRPLEDLTGFPEMLDGRVKTLNPMVHGGILYRRDDPGHAGAVLRHGIEPIDMVVVNLYPFEETARKAAPWSEELIENIDIGGVALLRAAAKNCRDVAVLTGPQDYGRVLDAMRANGGRVPPELKKELAVKAFGHTGAYDTAIHRALAPSASALPAASSRPEFADVFEARLNKMNELRYGENPHQSCALYSRNHKLPFAQLQGKELSYNNILDAYGAYQAVQDFDVPAAVVFKHVTPCGMGAGVDLREAFERAWASDPLSAFGGIIAVNRRLDGEIAEFLSKKFIEVICAPDFDAGALEVFSKKTNLRLLKWDSFPSDHLVLKSVGHEVLISEDDRQLLGGKWEVPTLKRPSAEETEALKFAWTAVKYVRSNAIVLADRGRTVGIGAGQMSRVDAVHMAGHKYGEFLKLNPKPGVLVMASDAFFPFPDSLETAAALGVTSVIQPGGSVKDKEVVMAADRLGLSMVLTGMRHFRH